MHSISNKPEQNELTLKLLDTDFKDKQDAISLCLSRLGYSQVEVMQDRLYIGNITYWFDQISKEYMKDYDAGIDISGNVLKAYIISPKEVEQTEVKAKRKYTKKIKEAHSENINIVRI